MNEPWRAYLTGLDPAIECRPSANAVQIAVAEVRLAVTFPGELKDLLAATNGVADQYGCHLVWPIERIEEDNLQMQGDLEYHRLYMPFDCLLFFSDAGNGDQFAYSICAGVIRRTDIYVWDHEDDSRTWVAPDLRIFLSWWTSGRIAV